MRRRRRTDDDRLAVGPTDVHSILDGCACGPGVLMGDTTEVESTIVRRLASDGRN